MWAFIWADLAQWDNELWDTGEKASPLENNGRVANVWGFRYYAGLSPYRSLALPDGCGHLFGRVCHNGIIDYWTPLKKQAFVLGNNNWVANVWEFPVLRGAVAR